MGIWAKSIVIFTILGVILTGIPSLYNEAYAIPIAPPPFAAGGPCDPIAPFPLLHELGEIDPAFAAGGEDLVSMRVPTPTEICVTPGTSGNDHEIMITNTSPFAWEELHFVTDNGFFVGNFDGFIAGEHAFRIDGTVTMTGVNDNLIFESITPDEIFECGETWVFLVTEFLGPGGFPLPVPFDSVGFAGFPPTTTLPSTASILANQHNRCPSAVGGEIIPLDTTMILVAGTQNIAAWMIPVIVSGIGIGIVIARKF